MRSVAVKRSYEDGCAAAHALDLVGERWALLVVRELLLGPKRFTDLRAGLPGISPNVLSQRLDELERAAVVQRRRLAPPAPAWVYELTDWGHELEPIIVQLGRWGARSPYQNRDAGLSVDSMILSLRTMFRPSANGEVAGAYQLRFGDDSFEARVQGDRFEIARGAPTDPDAVVETDPSTLAAVIYDGLELVDAIRAGTVRVSGDVGALERFLTLFSLPEPAPGCKAAPVTSTLN
jgi:DNA-binding HxlR family transcriptional regulator